ncbi:MAG: hypothetical protein SGPRY_005937 [Prymnesium sp.]
METLAALCRHVLRLPTVDSVVYEIDALERVRALVDGEDDHFLKAIEEFCLTVSGRFGDREEERQHSGECKEFPLEYTQVTEY